MCIKKNTVLTWYFDCGQYFQRSEGFWEVYSPEAFMEIPLSWAETLENQTGASPLSLGSCDHNQSGLVQKERTNHSRSTAMTTCRLRCSPVSPEEQMFESRAHKNMHSFQGKGPWFPMWTEFGTLAVWGDMTAVVIDVCGFGGKERKKERKERCQLFQAIYVSKKLMMLPESKDNCWALASSLPAPGHQKQEGKLIKKMNKNQ